MARGEGAETGTITLEAAVLAKAMKHAAGVVEARNTIPILSNVRLIADPDGLELAASDLDVEFRQRIPLVAGGALAITVDARRLLSLAQAVQAGAQMTLALEDKRLVVKAGRSRWVLPTLPADDFPAMPFAAEGGVAIAADLLAALVARTAPSVCTEITRSYLCGTLFNPEDGKLRLASTDGHRGMALDTPVEWPDGAPEVIVGPKFLRLATAMAESGEVRLSWDRGKIRAEHGEAVLTAKVIEGMFPDYRRVWPGDAPAPVRVDPKTLSAAVKRVSLVASEKTRSIKLERGDGKLVLSVTSPEGGTACEEVPADCEAGFETGFNAAYLLAMADAIGGETMEIHHQDAGGVARFTRLPRDGACGVLMPMRI